MDLDITVSTENDQNIDVEPEQNQEHDIFVDPRRRL
jgi:hypothetical protein